MLQPPTASIAIFDSFNFQEARVFITKKQKKQRAFLTATRNIHTAFKKQGQRPEALSAERSFAAHAKMLLGHCCGVATPLCRGMAVARSGTQLLRNTHM
jgi:hypothetical protein